MTYPSPQRFAAAAAVYDPSLLMRVQAQPPKPRRPLRGETGGALTPLSVLTGVALRRVAPVLTSCVAR